MPERLGVERLGAKRLGFLGPVGTYTEEAALLYIRQNAGRQNAGRQNDGQNDAGHSDFSLQPFPSIPAVGSAVISGIASKGVVPIENSLEGSVTFTLDLLIGQPSLAIQHEVVVPIEHFMMAKPGTSLSDIEVIFSHPQALAQCKEFLENCFPNAQQMASLSTVAALDDMKRSSVPAAAISPQRAADLNPDVEIIGRDIQDNRNNVTRFVVLAKEDHAPTGNDKTSICFSFQERDTSGLLYHALGVFSEREINLMKIESRPSKQSLGEYIFLIDCSGHREDPVVKEALDSLSEFSRLLRVFGSYPCWHS